MNWTRREVVLLPLLALLPVGCSPDDPPPESYTPEQKDAIDAAARAVRQFEEWGDKVEFKIRKHSSGWEVTAWHVVHPEAKGNSRYVPWGYRVIVVDRRGKVVEYKNSK